VKRRPGTSKAKGRERRGRCSISGITPIKGDVRSKNWGSGQLASTGSPSHFADSLGTSSLLTAFSPGAAMQVACDGELRNYASLAPHCDERPAHSVGVRRLVCAGLGLPTPLPMPLLSSPLFVLPSRLAAGPAFESRPLHPPGGVWYKQTTIPRRTHSRRGPCRKAAPILKGDRRFVLDRGTVRIRSAGSFLVPYQDWLRFRKLFGNPGSQPQERA